MRRRGPALLALGFALGTALAASAAAVEVTTAADENNGSLDPGLGSGTSLREAVLHAPAGSTLEFAPALDGATVTLDLGQIVISRDLAIDASALPSGVTVSGNDSSRVFDISTGKTVTMTRLKIIDGAITTVGGGIRNAGSLTLLDCELSSNRANDGGGAIRNTGTLVLNACTLEGNTAGVGGGAIEHGAGLLTLTNCTMTGNSAQWGGAIDGDGSSTIRLYSCTLAGNHASDKGGGIEETTGTLLLENSIIAGNTATNSGPDLKASAINTQLGVNLLSSTNGLGGGYAGIVGSPNLSALGVFGGPTRTMLPQAGSPAIDAGGATALAVDQRGLARVVGAKVDIGAVESGNPLPMVVVNTTVDENDGIGVGNVSLRDAIADASPGSIVGFAPALDGQTITLTLGGLVVDKDLTVDATSLAGGLTVTGPIGPGFDIGAGRRVSIKGLTIAGIIWDEYDDPVGGSGAAIRNLAGDLELDRCILSENYTDSRGGAVFNRGRLSMVDCTIFRNESGNDGGGMYNGGEARLTRCRFVRNGSWSNAATICNVGSLSMTQCTVSHGSANISGGGLVNERGAVAVIERCTFDGNVGDGGDGAIENLGTLTISNSTVSGNRTPYDGSGAGIGNSGVLTVESCTISGNLADGVGGGIFNGRSGQLTLKNSIVAGNSADEGGADLWGAIFSEEGVNLLGSLDGVDGAFSGIVADPMLAPLADNGGPTLTMLPLPGSPAIDAGGTTTLTVDQRGVDRVRGARVDIGSVETEPVIADWIVNTAADENNGAGVGNVSLREAIAAASPGANIYFAPALDGQAILLTAGSLVVGKDLVIDASALPAGIAVSGNGAVRVFDIPSGATVEMIGVKAINGRISGDGGGIRNAGRLTLRLCEVTGNHAGDDGGGVFSTGSLRLVSTRLGGNRANDSGGAIVSEGELFLSSCLLEANTADNGGAIYNDDALLTIEDSTFRDNSADDTPGGGAIDNDNGGEVSITRSTLAGNRSASGGGAIENDGKLTILACTLSGNTAAVGGGAIEHTAGILDLASSTLAGNSAKHGGAIDGDGTSTIRLNCCTVANNHASDKGGGIEETTGTLLLENSIVGANTATNSGPDLKVSSIDTQLGVNLVSSTNGLGGSFSGIVAPHPGLSPLANWGGPTETMVPGTGSPAIDAGGATTLTVDQRGFPRQDGRWIDIGAVEVQNYLLVTTSADSGAGSLRRIIELARPGSLIPFAPYLNGAVVTLTSGPLVIAKDLDFDASALPDGFNLTGEVTRGFDILAGRRVTMKRIHLWGFDSPWDDGAAIRNAGHLELTACSLTGNLAMNGGAIFSGEDSVLVLTDCELAHNTGEVEGGAISSLGNTSLIRTLVFSNGTGEDDGYGGGISSGGELSLIDSVIRSNGARVVGGIASRGSLNMLRCAVEDNEAWDGDAGGLSVGGSGGIIESSAFGGNFSLGSGGGIKHNFGELALVNCTIAANEAWDFGAGIFSQAVIRVESCTISGNTDAWEGGGIYVDPDGWGSEGHLTLVNSIVAGNDAEEAGPDLRGPIDAELGVNLLGTTDGVTTPFAGIVADPLLAPLGDYGGPTRTMPPLPGSPAINAGGATTLTVDQRGAPRVIGGKVDIGAVETSILFADDFSGPSPLSKYILENPSPGGGHSPMTIGVISGELTFDYLGGFGVVGVNLAQKHAFLNTAIECDIRFESPLGFDPRSSGGVAWVNGSSANGYLAAGLQLDENRAYIFAYDGTVSTFTSGAVLLDRNVNYRTRLEVGAPGVVKLYVNDVMVASLAFNLSLLPAEMNPNMGGNAQNTLRIVHDNFLVRKLD